MGKPEGEIEAYLTRQAELRGYLCFKFTSPGTDGVPDRILIGHGETFFVETKAPGEKPRALQDITFTDMIEHGAEVYIAATKSEIDQLFLKKRRPIPPAKTNQTPSVCRRTGRVILPQTKTRG